MNINIYNEAKYNPKLKELNENISTNFNWIKNHIHLNETPLSLAHFVIYSTCGYSPRIIQNQINEIRNKYSKIKPILFLLTDDVIKHVPLIDDGNIYITTAFNPLSKVRFQHSGAYPVRGWNKNWNRPRSTLASFTGSLTTHPLREKLTEIESDNIKIYGINKDWWAMTKEEQEERSKLFRDNMENSLFCLCPRGNGPTSIRLIESIVNGCIPVAIEDNTKILNDSLDFCIRKSFNEINSLEEELKKIQCNKNELQIRFKKMKAFCETKLETNLEPDNEITYSSFVYNKLMEYLNATIDDQS